MKSLYRNILAVVLILLVGSFYWQLCDLYFVQDDFWLIRGVQQGDWHTMVRGLFPDYMRPLTTYWWPWLMMRVYGLNPFPMHATLLVVFMVSLWFLFDFMWRVTKSELAAVVTMLMYGFAGTHVWTLSWLAGNIDVLCMLFVFVGLWSIDRKATWFTICCFLLALLSKEIAVYFILALILLNIKRWPLVGLLVGYAVAWKIATWGAPYTPQIGWHGKQAFYIAQASGILMWPVGRLTDTHLGWLQLLSPVGVFLLGFFLVSGRRWAAMGPLLWGISVALFFVFQKPPTMSAYYADTACLGLAMTVGWMCARLKGKWVTPVAVGVLLLYAIGAGTQTTLTISTGSAAPVYLAKRSAAMHGLVEKALKGHHINEIVLSNLDNSMQWATGKGVMFQTIYPEMKLDCRAGDSKVLGHTTDTRLVIRQDGNTLWRVP